MMYIYFAWVFTVSITVAYAARLIIAAKDLTRSRVVTLFFVLLVLVVTLILFSILFVFGEGSNVAQLSGSRNMWHIWVEIWFPIVFANFINLCFVLELIFNLPPYYGLANRIAFTSAVLSAAMLSFLHVYLSFPSA